MTETLLADTAGRRPDALPTSSTVWRIGVAVLAGAALTLVAWFILHAASLPAFNTSPVNRALSSAFSMLVILAVAVMLWFWIHERSRPVWRTVLTEILATLAPAMLVVTSLGIPLTATKLYLDGIQVDQGFRTQFLSRMTQTISNQDMNYIDLPTFYPMGWFWLGGRAANILDMPGWEVYQPWALISLAAAAAALAPVWRALTGSLPLAAAIAIATTAIVLTETADEPYAAVVAMFAPAAVFASFRALTGSWAATAGLAIYLGISATFYTLYTALAALTIVVIAIVLFFTRGRSLVPIKHLCVIGISSILIALIAWGPYLFALVSGDFQARSTANHFLPLEGTTFPLPFLSLSAAGLFSLIGLTYLVWKRHTPEVACLIAGLAVCYAWIFLSMVSALVGTSMLGFRVELLVILFFVVAGMLALGEIHSVGVDYFYPSRLDAAARRVISAVMVIVVSGVALFYVQDIPASNSQDIGQAYADTDANGERADRFPPNAGQYYGEIDALIREKGYEPEDTVVQTDEINFMAFNPYFGFNAFTSHYANPLGEFDLRTEELSRWAKGSYAELEDPDAMLEALDTAQWRAPDVFIFRGDLEQEDEPLEAHISHDIFPSLPNVRYEALSFNPVAFDSPAWDMEQVGPFVVVVRN